MFHRPIRLCTWNNKKKNKTKGTTVPTQMFNIIKLHLPLFYEWKNDIAWQPRRCFIVKSSRRVFFHLCFRCRFYCYIFTFIEFHPKERKFRPLSMYYMCLLFTLFCSDSWGEPCIYSIYFNLSVSSIEIKLNSNDHFKMLFQFFSWSRHTTDLLPFFHHSLFI